MGSKPIVNQVKSQMSRIVFYQLYIILGFTLLMFLLKGMQSGLSVLAGAMTYYLPTVAFIWRMTAKASIQAGLGFLAMFIAGEGIKLLLCGVLFVCFIKYLHVEALNAMIGLIAAIIAFWLASAAIMLKTGTRS